MTLYDGHSSITDKISVRLKIKGLLGCLMYMRFFGMFGESIIEESSKITRVRGLLKFGTELDSGQLCGLRSLPTFGLFFFRLIVGFGCSSEMRSSFSRINMMVVVQKVFSQQTMGFHLVFLGSS